MNEVFMIAVICVIEGIFLFTIQITYKNFMSSYEKNI